MFQPDNVFQPGNVQAFYTFNMLVQETGLAVHRVRYIINSRKIVPWGKVSHIYLYTPAALDEIKLAAEAIEEHWNGRPTPMA